MLLPFSGNLLGTHRRVTLSLVSSLTRASELSQYFCFSHFLWTLSKVAAPLRCVYLHWRPCCWTRLLLSVKMQWWRSQPPLYWANLLLTAKWKLLTLTQQGTPSNPVERSQLSHREQGSLNAQFGYNMGVDCLACGFAEDLRYFAVILLVTLICILSSNCKQLQEGWLVIACSAKGFYNFKSVATQISQLILT